LLDLNTFSIAAHDPASGMFGVCVSTRVPAVGAICPHARAGVGAVVTQARANPLFGIDGLDLLGKGYAAEKTIRALLDLDAEPERRQLLVVDSVGTPAAHTGSGCDPWRGHLTGEGYAVAGNLLVGPETLAAMAGAYEGSAGAWFTERLVRTLEAGQAAGGDRRGRQSAAIYVVHTEPYPYLDLRVDDHPDPVAELRRIYELVKTDLLPLVERLPTRANPEGELGPEIRGTVLPER
jgi:uncharacterized Ntn-hydrolase superfamily protein